MVCVLPEGQRISTRSIPVVLDVYKRQVYKLLWSPPNLNTPGGQPTVILESAPGLFYVLGGWDQDVYKRQPLMP